MNALYKYGYEKARRGVDWHKVPPIPGMPEAQQAQGGKGRTLGYATSDSVFARGLAHDMAERGVSVFLLHPGMVATEMTGRQGIPPEEAAADLVARINALGPGQSGTFWHAKDDPLPW